MCSAVATEHTRLTPGPGAQVLVIEPQSELPRRSAAPHSNTAFYTWPREGKSLARGHTAFIQPNIKCLLCEALYLGLGMKGEQKSHKLQAHGVYTLLEKRAKEDKPIKSEIVICGMENTEYFSQGDQGRSL